MTKEKKENRDQVPQVEYYRKLFTGLLTGESLDIPRERLDWTGYTQALVLSQSTSPNDRPFISQAIHDMILEENDWGLVADVVHLAYILKLQEVRDVVEAFATKRLPSVDPNWMGTIQRQLDTFLIGVPKD